MLVTANKFLLLLLWQPLQFEALGASRPTAALTIIAADVNAARTDRLMLHLSHQPLLASRQQWKCMMLTAMFFKTGAPIIM